MSNDDHAARRRMLTDATEGLVWCLEKIDAHAKALFDCDCDASYESDTNAWNHRDGCAAFQEDHLWLVVDELRAAVAMEKQDA